MKDTEIKIHQGVSKNPIYGKSYSYGCYIDWFQPTITVNELIRFIEGGHSWTSIYSPVYELKKTTFQSTNALVFNIKSIFTMSQYIEQMKSKGLMIPTFAYTPKVSDGMNQFKLVYCFKDAIINANFAEVYNNLSEKIQFDQGTSAKPGNAMTQTHCGCGSDGYVVKYGLVYGLKDVLESESLF